MALRIIILLLLCVLQAAAAVVTVSDTLISSDGTSTALDGRAIITWEPFTTAGNTRVAAGTRVVTITDGVISVGLESNTDAQPTGHSYRVVYEIAGQTWREFWTIPASGPATINDVAADTPPTVSMTVALTQLASSGATDGQCLKWVSASSAWDNQACLSSTALTDLSDVTITSPVTNDLLRYNGTAWVNTAQHAGTDITADLEEETHATEHQHGGDDEVATATPAADAIPKAEADGDLNVGWIPLDATYTWTGILNHTNATMRVPNSTTLPANCTVGDSYMDTDATSGQRWFLCEATDAWVVQGGGGGASALNDLSDVTLTTETADDILIKGAGDFINESLLAAIGSRLTNDRIPFTSGGVLTDSAEFLWDGTRFATTSSTVAGGTRSAGDISMGRILWMNNANAVIASDDNLTIGLDIDNDQGDGEFFRIEKNFTTELFRVSAAGDVTALASFDAPKLKTGAVECTGSGGVVTCTDPTAATGNFKLILKAGTGQALFPLEVHSNSGTVNAYINKDGTFNTVSGGGYFVGEATFGSWKADEFAVRDVGAIKWSSTAAASGAKDVGLQRDSAGKIKVTNGGSGYGAILAKTVECFDPTATTGVTDCVAQAGAGQGSTPISRWLNNAGDVLVSIGAIGSSTATLQINSSDNTVGRFQGTGAQVGLDLIRDDITAGGVSNAAVITLSSTNDGTLWIVGNDADFSGNNKFTISNNSGDAEFTIERGTGEVGIGTEDPLGTLHVFDDTATTGVTKGIFQAGAGQSATPIFEWQNNAGTVLAKIRADGGFQYDTLPAKPTCDSSVRGTSWYVPGGAGVADTYEVCVKDAADAYAWQSVF